jgi:hypothetical protein
MLIALLSSASVDSAEEPWLLLRGVKGPNERILSVRQAVPPAPVRAEFPIEVVYCKSYRAAANGLPADDAELRGLYEHEQALRALDPKQEVFLQALRETSNGRKCWTHYTRNAAAFRKLLMDAPMFASIAPSFRTDESWSALRDVLAKTRR